MFAPRRCLQELRRARHLQRRGPAIPDASGELRSRSALQTLSPSGPRAGGVNGALRGAESVLLAGAARHPA
ncbi:unnamed protein product [Lota lota]